MAKLQAFRKAHGVERLTLCVQKSQYTRALEWKAMVDFVDGIEEYPFHPNDEALATGFSTSIPRLRRRERRALEARPQRPLNAIMWPNAIIDAGRHLREWMPELALDLSFPVRTAPGPERRVVVYVSSVAINRSWIPNVGPDYWKSFISTLAVLTGQRPTLIGAPWDQEFREGLDVDVEDLLGKTNLPQVAGILERAAVVVGVISGMTIVANHFRTPTVALMADKHTQPFARAWVADDAPYTAIANREVPAPEHLAAIAAGMRRE